MERVGKLCKDAKKAYATEGIMSTSATIIRKKLIKALAEDTDPAKLREAVELIWRTAYYEPLAKLRRDRSVDERWIEFAGSLFCGELHSFVSAVPDMAALFNVYLGDIHRYSKDDRSKALAVMYYQRAVGIDREIGQPINQLGLLAKPLQDARLFLHALLCRVPFANAWENLSRTLDKTDITGLQKEAQQLMVIALLSYSRTDLHEKCVLWSSELRGCQQDELISSNIPLLVHLFTLSARLLYKRGPEEAFRSLLQSQCESLTFLLNKVRGPATGDEDDEVMIRRRRRRRRRDSEEEEETEDTQGRETPEEVVESPKLAANEVFSLSTLAVCAEWLYNAFEIVETMKQEKKTLPQVVVEHLDRLLSLLSEKCNVFVDVLDSVPEGEGAVEWVLRGPEVEGDRTHAIRAAAYWVFQCALSKQCPLAFAGYFKIQKEGVLSTAEMGRRMAKLRVEVGGNEDLSWVPVYIVPDVSAFEHRPHAIRMLLRGEKLTVVVPQKVLQHLDKTKTKSANCRMGLRMIHLGQQLGHIRVQDDGSDVMDCAKSLLPNDTSGQSPSSTLVAIVTNSTQDYENLELPGALAVHHIDTFCGRWNKEMSWRSL